MGIAQINAPNNKIKFVPGAAGTQTIPQLGTREIGQIASLAQLRKSIFRREEVKVPWCQNYETLKLRRYRQG